MIKDNLKIYMFNVGSGDHLMIEFPDKSIGIIDSFFSFEDLQLQEPPVVTYLKYRIRKNKDKRINEKIKIAFLCLSHADHDHIKNVELLFKLLIDEHKNIELENLLLFGGIDLELYKTEIEKLNYSIQKSLQKDAFDEFTIRAKSYINSLESIEKFKSVGVKKKEKQNSILMILKNFLNIIMIEYIEHLAWGQLRI